MLVVFFITNKGTPLKRPLCRQLLPLPPQLQLPLAQRLQRPRLQPRPRRQQLQRLRLLQQQLLQIQLFLFFILELLQARDKNVKDASSKWTVNI